jgi:hypothetical protein
VAAGTGWIDAAAFQELNTRAALTEEMICVTIRTKAISAATSRRDASEFLK